MARHIRALGLKTPHAYQFWCREAGVSESLDKSRDERAAELEIVAQREAAIKERTGLHRNPRKFLKAACLGEIDATKIDRPGWREIATAIASSKCPEEEREGLADFLLHLERVSDLVFETATTPGQSRPYADALVRLYDRNGQWRRDPEKWRPTSHNARRQFSSLARHLLAKYPVPAFLDEAWLRSDRGSHRFRDWFIHIGRGANIRTARTPYPLTKMIAHHFINAPSDVSIEGALMLADIQSLNGGERLAKALMGTRLGQRIERDAERRAFWLSVYRFFIANPMLDLRHAGPIVDFLSHQKFETQEVMVGPGQMETRPPPQPNLTMTRRTPESLLRQVEAWHGELRILRANDKRFWRPCGIPGLNLMTGPRDEPEKQTHWKLRELLSGQELIAEGRRMKHCVATYAESCASGAWSVWSLERRMGVDGRAQAMLTVAVDSNHVMLEARGIQNRWPSDQEKKVLDAWMAKADLKAGRYLYGW